MQNTCNVRAQEMVYLKRSVINLKFSLSERFNSLRIHVKHDLIETIMIVKKAKSRVSKISVEK